MTQRKRYRNPVTNLLLLLVLHAGSLAAQDQRSPGGLPEFFSGLDTDAAHIVNEFHRALKSGDEITIKRMLANNAVIFEGGKVERSRHEYASKHMQADIAFLKQVKVTNIEHNVIVSGDIALSVLRSRMKGQYQGKAVDLESLETMALVKEEDRWQIVHIHWSQ